MSDFKRDGSAVEVYFTNINASLVFYTSKFQIQVFTLHISSLQTFIVVLFSTDTG